ncbi:MAG TPA: DUF4129 domain-containing protein [Acidimicrobiales bacterium]|nr:DUF4129 domain-containing protein [Acidimicrobiales bacterium]
MAARVVSPRFVDPHPSMATARVGALVVALALSGLAGRGGAMAAGAEAPSAGAARAEARRILAGRRFQPGRTPRPLRGVLRRLGAWIRPVAEPVGRLWADVAGNALGRWILVVGVIGVAALTSVRLVRRRTAAGVRSGLGERRRRQEDPAELERLADRAERDGNLDLAFRLRFRAGLLRLDGAGLVTYRPSLTTGQLREKLHSPTFRALATAFDEIAYGGRPAGPADLEAARAGWATVLHDPGIDGRPGEGAALGTAGPRAPGGPGDRTAAGAAPR